MSEYAEPIAASTEPDVTRNDVPYPPSWIDRFTRWVDGLPMPPWFFYAALGILLTLTQVVVAQVSGMRPIVPLLPFFALEGGTIAYLLGLIHFLDRSAASALARFRPVMTVNDSEYERLRYEMTTLPTRPAWVAAAVGGVYTFVALMANMTTAADPARVSVTSAVFFTSLGMNIVIYALAGVLIYHTLHQLSLVNTLYVRFTRINLFRLRPLYALSGLTARTAIGSAIPTYLWFQANNLSAPGNARDIFQSAFLAAVIVVTFVWPLVGAHNLLEVEKQRLLDDTGRRIEDTVGGLNRRIDAGELAASGELKETLDVLRTTQEMIEKVPTWPWRTETIRSLGLTILVPVLIWLAQRLLERVGL